VFSPLQAIVSVYSCDIHFFFFLINPIIIIIKIPHWFYKLCGLEVFSPNLISQGILTLDGGGAQIKET
jgi:hypothetical protein